MSANAERMAGRYRRNTSRGEGYPIELYIETDQGLVAQYNRQQDQRAVQQFNRRVRSWGRTVNAALKASIATWIDQDTRLSSSLRQTYRHWGKTPAAWQEITSIGFAFEEAGLFVHLGVGRGYNREGGTVVQTGRNRSQMRRQPKPWFDPVVEQHLPALQQIVQDYCGDLFVDSTRILINR